MTSFTITGNIVDITTRNIYFGEIRVTDDKISEIKKTDAERPDNNYIIPGFIDSHVHIESSMLVPSEFARLAVVHGTVGTISDPHEIANVCGMEGVMFMINNSMTVPFKCTFGAPSCVPATVFETAGAVISSDDVDELLQMNQIKYLSEMMNFPGVLLEDEEVFKKIDSAKKYNKPIDGHAPGLRGENAKKYIDAGMSTDHECFTKEEALDKLGYGMKILIREGSAAKNFDALIDLLHDYPYDIMFCSDDKHPDSLVAGHINELCARAVKRGIDVFNVLQAACINPVKHYKMNVGLLNTGDDADFVVIKNLQEFEVLQTYINGLLVAENGKSLINTEEATAINQFDCKEKNINDFIFYFNGEKEITVIEALDGQLITNKIITYPTVENHSIVSDTERDILKIVVVNRYHDAPVAKAFIHNIGLKKGAIASSVAHDSHNIVAVGTNDDDLMRAVNLIIRNGGGISAVNDISEKVLALPVAGLMSTENGYNVANAYTAIDTFVKDELGSHLSAPFMTLSFMALLVIPHVKLSDKGLFDGDHFSFIYNH
ncbi:MAG: adenine deaminase [Ferruginibacter sp.]|nr:adenine deaminase [Ferruginibacter sp.]